MRTDAPGGTTPYFQIVDTSTGNDIQHLIDLYDGCIQYTDKYLGSLFQKLEDLSLLEKTIIIFTSDHGEEFYEHGEFGHGNVYVEHLHVPLIVRLPGQHGRRVEHDVSLIDLTPTILELLDISFRPDGYEFQGHSLFPLIDSKDVETEIYSDVAENDSISLKTEQWRYNEKLNYGNELFEIMSDPGEKKDVVDNYSDVVRTLQEKVENFRKDNKKYSSLFQKEVTRKELTQETVDQLKALGYVN